MKKGTFEWALFHMKDGMAMTRKSWKKEKKHMVIVESENANPLSDAFFGLRTVISAKNEKVTRDDVWDARHADILAEDWQFSK